MQLELVSKSTVPDNPKQLELISMSTIQDNLQCRLELVIVSRIRVHPTADTTMQLELVSMSILQYNLQSS
jgi:hypothetical protein